MEDTIVYSKKETELYINVPQKVIFNKKEYEK